MAETIKKAKAPAKASKTEEKKPAEKKTTEKKVTATKSKAAEPAKIHIVTHEEVSRLAHQYFIERGHQHGEHVNDWFRAEQELRNKAS
jgi:hypothetical protein